MRHKDTKFLIVFNTIECSRCHAKRIRGVTCPDCGATPAGWEIDYHLLRRRKLIAGVEDLLNTSPGIETETVQLTGADQLSESCSQLMAELISALREITQPEGTGEPLRQLVVDFVAFRHRVVRAQNRRPYLALGRLAKAVLDEIEQVIRHYLAVLSAAKPIDAQQHASLAQRHIDLAQDAVDDFLAYQADLERVDYSSVGSLLSSALMIKMARDGQSITELIETAEARVQALLNVEDGSAVGIQFVLADFLCALDMDQERFTRIFVDAHSTLVKDPKRLARIAAESPQLVEYFLDSQVSAFNSAWNARSAINNVQTLRQAVQAVLSLHTALLEGPGAVLTRVLLLASGHKQAPYSKLRDGHATEDIRKARLYPQIAPLLEGLDDHLRTAQSHERVRFTDHSVIATANRRSVELQNDDLADRVLQGLESVLAGVLALRQAFAVAGVTVDDAGLGTDLGLELLELARISLQMLTERDVNVELREDRELFIEIFGDPGDWHLTSLVAALGPVLDQADRFTLINADGERRILTGPTQPFRTPSPADEFQKQLRFISICTQLQLNGDPAITRRQIRKWCANMALAALVAVLHNEVPAITSARQIRAMVDLARLTADPELEAVLRQCSGWLGRRNNTDRVIEGLGSWATDDVDWRSL
jgi:hypothetical protein